MDNKYIEAFENVFILRKEDISVHPDDKSLAICITLDMGAKSILSCRIDNDAAVKLAKDLENITTKSPSVLN
tara:strand:- start:872 stop:1087 length:216 start_codon:yes stop_codon:yes gene_type:complete